MARDTRITMIAITIIISIMVNPNSPRRSSSPARFLPVGVIGSIRRLFRGLGINIEDILPTPTVGGRVILGAAHSPIGGVGEGILGDPPQKPDLLIHLALQF